MAVWFVSMSLYLVFDYAAFGIINLTNLNFSEFIMFHMFPTLIVTLLILVVIYGIMNYLYHATRQPDVSAYNVDQRDLNMRMTGKSRSTRL